MSTMYKACKDGDIDSVRLLLNSGADIEIKNGLGQTPLHLASLYGTNSDIAKLLLKCGANIESRTDGGYTPLHYAAWYIGGTDVVKLLIDSGADIEAKNNRGQTPSQVTTSPTIKAILHMSVLRGWRPWNHSEYPRECRETMKTLVLLAKA